MQYIERGKNGEPDIVYTEEEWQKKNRFNGCMAMIVAVGFCIYETPRPPQRAVGVFGSIS